jgi:hypothetical protein
MGPDADFRAALFGAIANSKARGLLHSFQTRSWVDPDTFPLDARPNVRV